MGLTVTTESPQHATAALWRDYDDQTSVLIDSLDNDEYQIALERHRRQIGLRDRQAGAQNVDVLPGEQTDYAVQCRLMGNYIVRGWRGATDAQGRPVEYSPKAATATLLADPKFFVWVLGEAQAVAALRYAEAQETVGKPSPGTGGAGNGADEAKSDAS